MAQLTENGAKLLDDTTESYRGAENQDDISDMLEKNNFEVVSDFGQYIVRMPHEHEEYGVLLEGDGNYVAKCRYKLENNLGINQCRREVKVALESELRGQENLFAEIIGWDSSEFSWVVMEEVEPEIVSRDQEKELRNTYSDHGWSPGDAEYGERDGEIVCFDYGHFDREGWKVSEDLLSKSERAF